MSSPKGTIASTGGTVKGRAKPSLLSGAKRLSAAASLATKGRINALSAGKRLSNEKGDGGSSVFANRLLQIKRQADDLSLATAGMSPLIDWEALRSALQMPVESRSEQHINDIASNLALFTFCHPLHRSTLRELAATAKLTTYPAGVAIAVQGKVSESALLVISGSADVHFKLAGGSSVNAQVGELLDNQWRRERSLGPKVTQFSIGDTVAYDCAGLFVPPKDVHKANLALMKAYEKQSTLKAKESISTSPEGNMNGEGKGIMGDSSPKSLQGTGGSSQRSLTGSLSKSRSGSMNLGKLDRQGSFERGRRSSLIAKAASNSPLLMSSPSMTAQMSPHAFTLNSPAGSNERLIASSISEDEEDQNQDVIEISDDAGALASVVAATDVEAIVLEIRDIQDPKAVADSKEGDISPLGLRLEYNPSWLRKLLKKSPITRSDPECECIAAHLRHYMHQTFAGFTHGEAVRVARSCVLELCTPGDTIVKSGSGVSDVTICLSGALTVHRQKAPAEDCGIRSPQNSTYSGDDEQVLCVVKRGEHWGQIDGNSSVFAMSQAVNYTSQSSGQNVLSLRAKSSSCAELNSIPEGLAVKEDLTDADGPPERLLRALQHVQQNKDALTACPASLYTWGLFAPQVWTIDETVRNTLQSALEDYGRPRPKSRLLGRRNATTGASSANLGFLFRAAKQFKTVAKKEGGSKMKTDQIWDLLCVHAHQYLKAAAIESARFRPDLSAHWDTLVSEVRGVLQQFEHSNVGQNAVLDTVHSLGGSPTSSAGMASPLASLMPSDEHGKSPNHLRQSPSDTSSIASPVGKFPSPAFSGNKQSPSAISADAHSQISDGISHLAASSSKVATAVSALQIDTGTQQSAQAKQLVFPGKIEVLRVRYQEFAQARPMTASPNSVEIKRLTGQRRKAMSWWLDREYQGIPTPCLTGPWEQLLRIPPRRRSTSECQALAILLHNIPFLQAMPSSSVAVIAKEALLAHVEADSVLTLQGQYEQWYEEESIPSILTDERTSEVNEFTEEEESTPFRTLDDVTRFISIYIVLRGSAGIYRLNAEGTEARLPTTEAWIRGSKVIERTKNNARGHFLRQCFGEEVALAGPGDCICEPNPLRSSKRTISTVALDSRVSVVVLPRSTWAKAHGLSSRDALQNGEHIQPRLSQSGKFQHDTLKKSNSLTISDAFSNMTGSAIPEPKEANGFANLLGQTSKSPTTSAMYSSLNGPARSQDWIVDSDSEESVESNRSGEEQSDGGVNLSNLSSLLKPKEGISALGKFRSAAKSIGAALALLKRRQNAASDVPSRRMKRSVSLMKLTPKADQLKGLENSHSKLSKQSSMKSFQNLTNQLQQSPVDRTVSDLDKLVDQLSSCSLFGQLSRPLVRSLVANAKQLSVSSGTVIFRQGYIDLRREPEFSPVDFSNMPEKGNKINSDATPVQVLDLMALERELGIGKWKNTGGQGKVKATNRSDLGQPDVEHSSMVVIISGSVSVHFLPKHEMQQQKHNSLTAPVLQSSQVANHKGVETHRKVSSYNHMALANKETYSTTLKYGHCSALMTAGDAMGEIAFLSARHYRMLTAIAREDCLLLVLPRQSMLAFELDQKQPASKPDTPSTASSGSRIDGGAKPTSIDEEDSSAASLLNPERWETVCSSLWQIATAFPLVSQNASSSHSVAIAVSAKKLLQNSKYNNLTLAHLAAEAVGAGASGCAAILPDKQYSFLEKSLLRAPNQRTEFELCALSNWIGKVLQSLFAELSAETSTANTSSSSKPAILPSIVWLLGTLESSGFKFPREIELYLAQNIRPVALEPGQLLYAKDDAPDEMYIVCEGVVDLKTVGSMNRNEVNASLASGNHSSTSSTVGSIERARSGVAIGLEALRQTGGVAGRMAEAKASENGCVLLGALKRNQFETCMEVIQEYQTEELAYFLKNTIPAFASWHLQALRSLVATSKPVSFRPGEKLTEQNRPLTRLSLIVKGRVRLVATPISDPLHCIEGMLSSAIKQSGSNLSNWVKSTLKEQGGVAAAALRLYESLLDICRENNRSGTTQELQNALQTNLKQNANIPAAPPLKAWAGESADSGPSTDKISAAVGASLSHNFGMSPALFDYVKSHDEPMTTDEMRKPNNGFSANCQWNTGNRIQQQVGVGEVSARGIVGLDVMPGDALVCHELAEVNEVKEWLQIKRNPAAAKESTLGKMLHSSAAMLLTLKEPFHLSTAVASESTVAIELNQAFLSKLDPETLSLLQVDVMDIADFRQHRLKNVNETVQFTSNLKLLGVLDNNSQTARLEEFNAGLEKPALPQQEEISSQWKADGIEARVRMMKKAVREVKSHLLPADKLLFDKMVPHVLEAANCRTPPNSSGEHILDIKSTNAGGEMLPWRERKQRNVQHSLNRRKSLGLIDTLSPSRVPLTTGMIMQKSGSMDSSSVSYSTDPEQSLSRGIFPGCYDTEENSELGARNGSVDDNAAYVQSNTLAQSDAASSRSRRRLGSEAVLALASVGRDMRNTNGTVSNTGSRHHLSGHSGMSQYMRGRSYLHSTPELPILHSHLDGNTRSISRGSAVSPVPSRASSRSSSTQLGRGSIKGKVRAEK